jgi:hypothetical protein
MASPSVRRLDYVRSENYSSKYIAMGPAESAVRPEELMSKLNRALLFLRT